MSIGLPCYPPRPEGSGNFIQIEVFFFLTWSSLKKKFLQTFVIAIYSFYIETI